MKCDFCHETIGPLCPHLCRAEKVQAGVGDEPIGAMSARNPDEAPERSGSGNVASSLHSPLDERGIEARDVALLTIEHRLRGERIAQLEDAIRWALGEVGEFEPEMPPAKLGEAVPRYWWRIGLRKRAAITAYLSETAPSALETEVSELTTQVEAAGALGWQAAREEAAKVADAQAREVENWPQSDPFSGERFRRDMQAATARTIARGIRALSAPTTGERGKPR